MELQAVIFDLYNTVAYINPERYRATKKAMASKVGLPEDVVFNLWWQYSQSANRGDILTSEERILCVLRDSGIIPSREVLRELADTDYELHHSGVDLGESSEQVLRALKAMGLKLGLVSNAAYSSWEVPERLGIARYFDTVVISSAVRTLKPGAKIYQIVVEQLGTKCEQCLYVGDGDDNELDGAAAVGMRTVHLAEDRRKLVHNEQVTGYQHVVTDLSQVVGLVNSLRSGSNP